MQNLETIRRLRGLSQKNLADQARIAEGTVAGIEAGRHAPRASTARKLAAALGVEVADLYGEAIPKAPSGSKTGDDLLAERLASRITRLEHMDLADLSLHRAELAERLANLKEPVEYQGGIKYEITDYPVYLETTDELLATMMVLERTAGRVSK